MTILVTRPEPAAAELVSRLHALGKQAWSLPLIEFAPGADLTSLPQKLAALRPGDLVFILSQQVIHYAQHTVTAWPAELDYYAIGRSTALAFQERYLQGNPASADVDNVIRLAADCRRAEKRVP